MAGRALFGNRPTPEHLYGQPRADRAMVSTRWLVGAWMPVWERVLRYEMRQPGPTALDVEVAERTSVSDDGSVVSLGFRAVDGDLPTWTAGAHIRLMLPSGRIREYSLCGHPGDTEIHRIAVRRLCDDGASAEVHTLQVGDRVRITRPLNAFPLVLPGHGSSAQRVVFIAGGIGITPILPMIETAERLGAQWSLMYVGRSRSSLAFLDRLSGYGDRITIRTDDAEGIPTPADLIAELDAETSAYFCGPAALTDLLLRELSTSPDCAEVHYERFGVPVAGGREFTVVLGSDGRSVEVGSDESMLHAVARAVPSITYSCRQGFCGTCKLKVVEGEVEHGDSVLTDHERAEGYMLPCVSRAAGPELIVDL